MADPFEQYLNKAKATLAGGEDDDQQAPKDPFSAYVAKKQEAVQPQGDPLDEALKRPDIGGPIVEPPPLPTEAPAQPAGAFLLSKPAGMPDQNQSVMAPAQDKSLRRMVFGGPGDERTYLGQFKQALSQTMPNLGIQSDVKPESADYDAFHGSGNLVDTSQHPVLQQPLTKTVLGTTASEELEKLLKNVPQDKQGNLTPFQSKALNDAISGFAGGVQGITGAVEGLSSPENIAIMASMANPLRMPGRIKQLASLIFAKQMGEGAYHDFQEARKAELAGNLRQAGQMYTSGMINALFTVLSGSHAVHGEGIGEHEANIKRAQEYYQSQGHSPADSLDMAKHAWETYKATGDINRMPPIQLDEFGHQKATSRFQPITATRETQQPHDATPAPEVAQDAFTRYLEASRKKVGLPEQQPEVRAVPEGPLGLDKIGYEQTPEAQPSAFGAKASVSAPEQSQLGFYSHLEKVIQDKMPERATPEQILGLITNPQSGVKADELKYSGLVKEMEFQTKNNPGGKYSKQDVLEFLKKNRLPLEEKSTRMLANPEDEPHINSLQDESARLRVEADDTHRQAMDKQQDLYRAFIKTYPPSQFNDFLDRMQKGDADQLGELQREYPHLWENNADAANANEYWNLRKKWHELTDQWYAIGDALHALVGEHQSTKYERYTLPGGKNYREDKLVMPERGYGENDYQSGHFEEPNIITHERAKDRVGEHGEKTYHVEEVQSDLHHKGERSGYDSPENRAKIKRYQELWEYRQKLIDVLEEHGNNHIFANLVDAADDILAHPKSYSDAERHASAEWEKVKPEFDSLSGKVSYDSPPDFPYKKTWHELAMRRALRKAAEGGYDQLAWTTGEQQADRYNLAKHVDEVVWTPTVDGYGELTAWRNRERKLAEVMPESKLADYVGKEVAARLVKAPTEKLYGRTRHVLRGLDLKVGGQHHVRLYDEMIPRYMDKLGKRFGVKTERGKVSGDDYIEGPPAHAESGYHPDMAHEAHIFRITPEMREAILREGQPQYKRGLTETRDQMHAKAPVEYIKPNAFQPGAVWINDAAHQAFSQALVDAGEETNNANSWQAITVHKMGAYKLIMQIGINLAKDAHEKTSNIPRVRQDYADKLALLHALMQNFDNDGHLIAVKSTGMSDVDATNLSHEQVHHVQNQWFDKLGVVGMEGAERKLVAGTNIDVGPSQPDIIARKVLHGLETYGYKMRTTRGNLDLHQMWAEGSAHILTGEYLKLGLMRHEAVEFLDRFLDGVIEAHGGSRLPLYDLIHQIAQIDRIGREAIDRANERHKPVFPTREISGESQAGAGNPREVQEQPRGAEEGTREPAGRNPAEQPGAAGAGAGSGDIGPNQRPPFEPPDAGGNDGRKPPEGQGPFGAKAAAEPRTGVREIDEDIERQLNPPGPVKDLSPRTLWNKSAEKVWDRFAFWRAAVNDMAKRGVQFSPDNDPGVIFDLTYGGTHGIVEAEMLDLKDTVKAADKDGVLWHLRGILNLKGYSRVFDINQERMSSAHTDFQRANYNAKHASSDAKRAFWKQKAREASQELSTAQEKASGASPLVPRYKNQAEVQAKLKELEAADPVKFGKALTYANRIWDMNRKAWDEAKKSGIISDPVYQQGLGRGKEYIPMQRIMDQVVDDTYQRALAAGIDLKRQDILKNLQGSALLNREPIGASFDQFTETVKEVARNEAAKVAIAALQKDPVYSTVVKKLEPGEAPPLGFGAIGHYENGERVTHVLPRLLADALNTANARDVEPFTGVIGKVMKAARTVSQLGYTGWNLAFSIPNVIKDQKDLLLLSKIVRGGNPVAYANNLLKFEGKWLAAAYHILRKDQAYREFLKSKVAYAGLQKQISPKTFLRLGREGFYEGMSKSARFRTAVGKVSYFGGGFLVDGIANLNNALEEASKMSAYNTLREQGLDPTAAAIEARRFGGSPDFAVGGTMKQELDTLFLFFNARTQGIIRTASRFGGLKDHPIMVGGLTSLALMAYAHNMQYKSDDGTPEYDHLSPQIKQNYWTWFLPVRYQTAKGDHRWLAVHMPKSHVEQVLVNPVSEMLQKAFGDPKTPTQIMLDAAGNATPINFNVQQSKLKETGVRSLVSSLNPAIREPVEQMTNEDTLTGAPIVPKRMLPYEPQYQDTPSTNPTSRFIAQTKLGKAMGLSAPRVQHAVRTMAGGAGEMLLGVGDAIANKADARARNYAALEEGPEQFSRAPIAGAVLRRFVASGGDEQERSDLDKLYHHYDKAEQVVREVNAFEKQGTPESHAKAVEILKADPMNQFYYDNFGPIQATIKNIGELRNALIAVQNAGVIGDEKGPKNANPAARLALRKKAISALYKEYRHEVRLGADLRFDQDEEQPEQQQQEQVQ